MRDTRAWGVELEETKQRRTRLKRAKFRRKSAVYDDRFVNCWIKCRLVRISLSGRARQVAGGEQD